jgi:citrate lyase alpha subunit
MATVNYQAAVDALETALINGKLRVEVNGELVIYQSAGDMITRLNYFKGQLALAAGTSNTTLAAFVAG